MRTATRARFHAPTLIPALATAPRFGRFTLLHRRARHFFGFVAILLLTPVAQAATWTEVGDAGESLATSDVTTGVGSLTTIDGGLIDLGGEVDDVDPPLRLPSQRISAWTMTLRCGCSTRMASW